MKRPQTLFLCLVLALSLSSAAVADTDGHHHTHAHTRTGVAAPPDYGARGALRDSSVTVAEALTYALQDEYLAQARHDAAMAKFGIRRPFSQAQWAQQGRMRALRGLARRYSLPLPPNHAAAWVIAPRSLQVAYQTAVKGETEKVAMYEKLSSLPELPQDVRDLMSTLAAESRRSLTVFLSGLRRVD